MYSKEFSHIYNTYGWNYYPEMLGEQLLKWLKEMPVKRVLDLGCGTGILCGMLDEAGYEVRGIDLSEEMLMIACEKYPRAHFEKADIVTYRTEETYDLVTATYDVINHILEEKDVREVFEGAYAALVSGGTFLLDYLVEGEDPSCDFVKLEDTPEGELGFVVERGENGLINLSTVLRSDSEAVTRIQVTERIYPPEMFVTYLKEVGFGSVTLSDHLPGNPDGHGTVGYIIAKK